MDDHVYILGEISYKAYADEMDNKNFLGKEMPKFKDLTFKQQQAWDSAAKAAIQRYREAADMTVKKGEQEVVDRTSSIDFKRGC